TRHAKGGLVAMKPEEAMRAFQSALLSNEPHITIANINWKQYIKQLIAVPEWLTQFAEQKASKNTLLSQLEEVSLDKRLDIVKSFVESTVRQVLGITSSQVIDEKKGFFDMGLDSL